MPKRARTLMKSLFCFLMLMPLLAMAKSLPIDFDPQAWNKLIQTAVQTGDPLLMNDDLEMRVLKNILPNDPMASHQADYFSTVGYTNSQAEYQAYEISVVSENWQKTEDNQWLIDQWIYRVSIEGELLELTHDEVYETMDRQYLGGRNFPVGSVNEPEQIAIWGKKLAAWSRIIQ